MKEELGQFRRRQREDEAAQTEQGQQAASTEFDSVEEVLRVDRERTALPSRLAERVSQAIGRHPTGSVPWWSRWFRRR